MTILVTGADGYVGWPVLLRLAETFPDERIVGVNNFARRRWVEEIGQFLQSRFSLQEKEKGGLKNSAEFPLLKGI